MRIETAVGKNQKREEILAVARRLFLESGYEATSIGRIAEESGVAPNTIYWYFTDKDALLIAVLDMLFAEGAHEFRSRKRLPIDAQLVWFLGMFDSLQSLIATVHARTLVSPALAAWHEQFHQTLEAALLVGLRKQGMPEADLVPASRVVSFVLEGLLAHPSSASERRALIRWLLSSLVRAPRKRTTI